jgi:RES domain-containing protein
LSAPASEWSGALLCLSQDVTEFHDPDPTQIVGSPEEVVRLTPQRYMAGAVTDFSAYVTSTVTASMHSGGRYNPQCEFGAVYCADAEETAWREVQARLAREGVVGLPEEMAILRILVKSGMFANFHDDDVCAAWDTVPAQLVSDDPADTERLHDLGRQIRVVADFIAAPSARREGGTNYAFFPDRRDSMLEWTLISASVEPTPVHLQQQSREGW